MVGDSEGVVVIPAHLAGDIAAEATEMTAFEDFVTERVQAGETIIGLYPHGPAHARGLRHVAQGARPLTPLTHGPRHRARRATPENKHKRHPSTSRRQTMHSDRRHVLQTFAALAATALPLSARAQEWPAGKPIAYVVPFTPGGSTDTIGRVLASKLQESLKQAVVVDNRPGQGGSIGAAYVAKAPADGYTLFGGTISTHAINASLYKSCPTIPCGTSSPYRSWPRCRTCSSSTPGWA